MRQGTEQRSPTAHFGGFALLVLCDMAAPVALYYLLRAAGVGQLAALLLSGVPVALRNVAVFARRRRVEGFGVFVLAVVLLSAAVSLITGSPRLLLIRDGWFAVFISVLSLGSLFARRPLTFLATTTLLPHMADRLERLYAEHASFRRVFAVLTIVWGAGTLLDAAIRVWMAYSLPIDTVPALDTVLSIATFVVLQVITQILLLRNDSWHSLWPRRRPRPA